MLNHIILVGKVKEVPVLKETSSGIKFANVLIDVVRNFKNSEGEYESDTISCIMWRGVAESSLEYCQKGAIVGVKGRLQSHAYTNEEKITYYNYDIVVEKISFVSSSEETSFTQM